MADEDEILRFAQEDTVKQLRGMRIMVPEAKSHAHLCRDP
jgi:hypothetical protein